MENDKRHDVFDRIAEVQQSVEAVKRTTEGYGYKYATLDDVWQLVKDSMEEHGLGWTAVCASDTNHCSSSPGGVRMPRLTPHSQDSSASWKSVAL